MPGEIRASDARTPVRRGSSLIDVIFATFIVVFATLMWTAIYPTASRTSRATTDYSQVVSEVQHKVEQLRSLGFGRMTFTELRNAGIIDATPTTSPYTFTATDSLSTFVTNPTGTITITSPASDLRQAVVSLTWRGAPGRDTTHAVTILIAQD